MFGVAGNANSALIDRGGGLIYDTVLDVTWLQDANFAQTSGYDNDGRMSWDAAAAWAEQLQYGGHIDWRLPKVSPVDGSTFNLNYVHDGSTDFAENISAADTLYSGSTS